VKGKVTYTSDTIRSSLISIKSGSSIYKASKHFGIPWSTLKDYATKFLEDPSKVDVCKNGKPFVLPTELELKVVNYVTKMQDIGFGLTVNQVRHTAFQVAETVGIKHPFNKESKLAEWHWWMSFKARYNLSLRTPQNLSIS
jgi:hypothetical protein